MQLTSKCAKLQDRTMALAKELAALKLCVKLYFIFVLLTVFRSFGVSIILFCIQSFGSKLGRR